MEATVWENNQAIAGQKTTTEDKKVSVSFDHQLTAGNTLRIAKQTIRAALENEMSKGVAIEAEAFANLFDTEDKEIGVQAFLARETAVWKHK